MTKYVLVIDILRQLFYHNGELYEQDSLEKYRNSEKVQNMIIEFNKKNHVKFSKVILQEMRLIAF